MPKHAIKIKDNLTKEEIRTLLASTTSVKVQAIIHCLKDSGMAVGDLADLNVGDLSKALENGDKFTMIEYARNKTEVSGTPCFGPEALEALRIWMRFRRTANLPCGPDKPLFLVTEARNPEEVSRSEIARGRRLSGRAMTSEILWLVRRSGVANGKRISAHCFRIFNQSSLESAGVNKNIIYRIQARLIPDSGQTYSKDEVLSSYIRAYENLAVGPRPQIIEVQDSRVAELQVKLERQAEINRSLAEEIQAIKKLVGGAPSKP